MTALDLITSTLRLGGVLASGETPTASEASDALSALNQMLSSWATENLTVFQKVREEFTLTPGDGSYTWGTSGDFNSTRPIEVLEARLEVQTGNPIELPVRILSLQEYADIRLKGLSTTYPCAVYFDGANPLLGVEIWPIPNSAEKIVFYSKKPFSTLTLNTTLAFPPGYEKALRYNLWVDLAPEYGRPVDQIVLKQAMDSKGNIKRKNLETPLLKTESPVDTQRKSFLFERGE